MNKEISKVAVTLKGGGSLVSCKPVFSIDSRFLLIGSGDVVKVVSNASGERLHSLRGHSDVVTSIVVNPANQFQIFSSSRDRTIIKWDYEDGVLLKRYAFKLPICSFCPSICQPNLFFAVLELNQHNWNVVEFNFPRQPTSPIDPHVLIRGVRSRQNYTAVGHQGTYIACIRSQGLVVYNTQSKQSNVFDSPLKMTCVACHPQNALIATGLKDGRIALWYNFLESKSVMVQKYLHWHALPVRDMVFTLEGSYLLSGGYECVLVKWSTTSDHYKNTLPRLGAPIMNLVCSRDNTLYATCHVDNGIQVITNNFRIIQSYQGLVQGHLNEKQKGGASSGILYDPRTGSLVLNGRPGQLQFYDVNNDQQLYSLDVVGQNYISPQDLTHPLVLTQIENAAFDVASDWLATVERRDDGETSVTMLLKFWAYDKEMCGFVLNTSVNLPHKKSVHTLRFRLHDVLSDRPLMAVTTSSDGQFKLWTLGDDTDIFRANVCWCCESVGFYHSKPAGAADFSRDGSLLAVAFDDIVTLWDPECNLLQDTISLGDVHVRHLLFGNDCGSHMLLMSTDVSLYGWNLLTGALLWNMSVFVTTIESSLLSDVVVVFADNRDMYILRPQHTKPIVFERSELTNDAVIAAKFVPQESRHHDSGALSWQTTERLYFFTKKQELLTLVYESENKPTRETAKLTQHLPQTAFSLLMAEKKVTGAKDSSQDFMQSVDSQFLKEILTTPAHVLPPVSTLCSAFIESLLIAKKTTSSTEQADNDDDDDKDQDSDSSETESEAETPMEIST